MSHIEELINNLLRAEATLDLVELSYLDADTSIDKRRADAALESAVYAQFESDGMLDAYLDEVWDVTFADRFAEGVILCSQCHTDRTALTGGCGYCRDYEEATS